MLNIPPINKGIPVLEKATNFLSGQFLRWLQSVESRLNKAVVTDANGEINQDIQSKPHRNEDSPAGAIDKRG